MRSPHSAALLGTHIAYRGQPIALVVADTLRRVRRAIDVVEHHVELTREQYLAQLDVSAAPSRVSQLRANTSAHATLE